VKAPILKETVFLANSAVYDSPLVATTFHFLDYKSSDGSLPQALNPIIAITINKT